MISLFRNFAKSRWAVGLLALVALSLLVTGAQMDVFSGLGPKHVISAGDRSVDQNQFRVEFDRIRENYAKQAGRPVTVEDLVKENVHVRYLEEQTRRMGFLNWAWEAGVRPGKELVLKQIRGIPAFFNQVTGQFDEAQYGKMLAENNVTPAQLEQEFRDQYVTNHFGSAVIAGLRVPRVYGALLAGRALETRDGRWFAVTQAMAGATAAPNDAQLTAFMSENAAQLRLPEFRIASIVLFSANQAASTAPIPEARIVERFNFRKDALSTPETRSFVTLTAPTRAAADRIAAALRAGQTPDQAGAAGGGIRPAEFTATPRSAVPDPAVGAAVFGLAANQVSDPVQGRVGFTVVRVASITPGQSATLDSVRDALVAELRAEDATGQVFSRVEAYEKARTDGKTLAQAAEQVGARIVQLPPFTQDGRLPDGQQMNAPPQLLQTAWSLTKGGESEIVDAGQGQYFVLRLDDIRPAALPLLADIRAPLTQQWTMRENAKRLTAKAEELAARVRGGQDIAAVAASAGATLTSRSGIQQNPQTQTELGQGVLQGLFGQGKGQVFTGPQSQTAFVVGRVDAVRAPVAALAAPIAEQVRGRIGQDMGNAMVELAFDAAARATTAKHDPALALQALGVTTPAPAIGLATPATAKK